MFQHIRVTLTTMKPINWQKKALENINQTIESNKITFIDENQFNQITQPNYNQNKTFGFKMLFVIDERIG